MTKFERLKREHKNWRTLHDDAGKRGMYNLAEMYFLASLSCYFRAVKAEHDASKATSD